MGILDDIYRDAGYISWYAGQKQASSSFSSSSVESQQFHSKRAALRDRLALLKGTEKGLAWLKAMDGRAVRLQIDGLEVLLKRATSRLPLPTTNMEWRGLETYADDLMTLSAYLVNSIEEDIEKTTKEHLEPLLNLLA